MQLVEHCTYTSDEVIGTGTDYQILGLEYINYQSESYILKPSSIWSEIQARDHIDSVSTYSGWRFVPGENAVLRLSENNIETLELGIDNISSLIGFNKSDCVMIPRLYDIQQATEKTIPLNIQFQLSLLEVWVFWILMIFALGSRIIKIVKW